MSEMDAERRLRRGEILAAVLLTLVAVLLHVRFLLHAGALWRDEANTVAVATLPSVGAVAGALEHESFPMLPFVLVRAWSVLGMGGSDLALRFFGLLVGLAILAALWTASRFLESGPPLFALAFLALDPVVLRWGDSVRGYGLGALLILIACALVAKLVRSPSRAGVALAAAAAVLSVQAVYQNLLLVAVVLASAGTVALLRGRWRVAAACAGIALASGAFLLPYRGVIARAQDHFVIARPPADTARVLATFLEALASTSEGGLAGISTLLLWVAACALTVVVLLRCRARDVDRRLHAALTGVAAPAAFLVFVLRLRFHTEPWYFIVLVTVLASCLDLLWSALATTAGFRAARVAIAVLAGVSGIVAGYGELGARQTNADRVAQEVSALASEGDLVVVDPWYCAVSFNRYYRGAAAWTSLPPLEDSLIHRFDRIKERMVLEDPMGGLMARAEATLRTGHRVFLVGWPSFPPAPPPKLPPAPAGPEGWYFVPYSDAWSAELGYFLNTRAAAGAAVPIDSPVPVSRYENLLLFRFEGLRASE